MPSYIETSVKAQDGSKESLLESAQTERKKIDRYENKLHAWVALSDDLEQQAADIAQRAVDNPDSLPLLGVSVGIKDLIDVVGLPTRSGSDATDPSPKNEDAPFVTKLRELGAIIQGKTRTTEFGYFFPGPTTNPFNHEHTPGGSSSGSAAAVGSKTVPLAIGTQTAGSLTRPASYCGCAGMVMTREDSDLKGVAGLSHSLDSLGLVTRSVNDLKYVWSHLTGNAPLAEQTPVSDVYVWDGEGAIDLEPEMALAIQSLPQIIRANGATAHYFDWSDHVFSLSQDHKTVMAYEACRTLADTVGKNPNDYSPQLQDLVASGEDIVDDRFSDALIRRDRSLNMLLDKVGPNGIIIGPAAPGPAPKGLDATGSPDLSRPWQLLGLPVVTVPGLRTVNGLPLGIQVIGFPGRESQLFAFAEALEGALSQSPNINKADTPTALKEMSW